MATLTFNGESYTVDHAVKGGDYIHGYDANGVMVACITGVANFDAIGYDGEYMSPEECAEETCNEAVFVDGALKTKKLLRIMPAGQWVIKESCTLKLEHVNTVIFAQSADAITITIPVESTVAIPTYSELEIVRYGAGSVTFAPASDVTLLSVNSARSISDQYGCVTLRKIGTNLWLLAGALS